MQPKYYIKRRDYMNEQSTTWCEVFSTHIYVHINNGIRYRKFPTRDALRRYLKARDCLLNPISRDDLFIHFI